MPGRLDGERRRRLSEIAVQKGAPVSEVVRCLIDDAYENIMRGRRRRAVERLIGMAVEDPSGYVMTVWGFQDENRTPNIGEKVDLLGYARIR